MTTIEILFSENTADVECINTSLISYNLEIVIKVVSVLVHHGNIILVQLTVLGL